MSANDVILVGDALDRSRRGTSDLNQSEQEAYFLATHYLREYNPGHDDVLSGIVDGTRDGGIDSIHIFANRHCIRDDINGSAFGRSPHLDLIITQVKNSASLGEDAVDKLVVHLPRLLSFSRDEDKLAAEFNPRVLEITRRFLDLYRTMHMPSLSIYICLAALKAEGIHRNVKLKGDQLAEALRTCFGNCEPYVQLYDAAAVLEDARHRPPVSAELTLAENPISTDMAGGFVGLVKLAAYQTFITDPEGNLDASLFESNVRDYERESGVNKAIQATLREEGSPIDFWWLNNGVTIVADRVQSAGKILELESPQIVNGLQTSHEIYLRGLEVGHADDRSLLVKVIQADKDPVKDRIIRATNSQTALATSAVRATDLVQRNIEQYFQTKSLFYERRKNFYANQSLPLAQLVSIEQLGQATLATLVRMPHVARGEVSKIFADEIYEHVFSGSHPLGAYYSAISIVRTCEAYLRENRETRGQVEDFVYYLAMSTAIAMTRKNEPSARDLEAISGEPTDELLRALMGIVRQSLATVAERRRAVLLDRVAKDPEVTQVLETRMRQYLSSTPRGRY